MTNTSIQTNQRHCKLQSSISTQLGLPVSDIDMMLRYHSSTSILERVNALSAIIEDDGFINRQADLLCRYIDGRWLKLDFDKLVISFDITEQKSRKIIHKLDDKLRINPTWKVKRIEKHKNTTSVEKCYKENYTAKCKNKGKIHISILSRNISRLYRNIRIEFSPSYFSSDETRAFFDWLFNIFGNEKKSAIDGSIITKLDFGFQLHNIFSPFITISPSGKSYTYNWMHNNQDRFFAQALYDVQSRSGIKSTNLSYCPVSNLLYKVFKKRPYTCLEAYKVISSVTPAARLESRYQYQDSGVSKSFSLTMIKGAPFDMYNMRLITPEQFRTLSHDERFELASTKRVDKSVTNIDNITLPKKKLLTERNRLIDDLLCSMGVCKRSE